MNDFDFFHPESWSRRGYLPHFDEPGVTQFLTVRLDDSLPAYAVNEMRLELEHLPADQRRYELSSRIDEYLDAGHGECVLGDDRCAGIIASAMQHFDGERYKLHAWVVMPNHIHSLLTVLEGYSLGRIIGSWKQFSALRINRLLGRDGPLWQREHYDRTVRNERHFKQAAWYIHTNPVKAGLCDAPEEYRWSSAGARRSFKDCR